MAEAVQTEVIPGVPVYLSSPVAGHGKYPYGIMSHKGSFEVDAIGVGDTGRLRIILQLTIGTWYKLKSFHLDLSSTAANNLWTSAQMECFYNPQIDPTFGGATVSQYFPMISNNDIDLTYIRVKNYIFGILGDLADFAYSPLGPMSTPADFMYTGIQDSPNTAPTIEIVNQNASQLVEQCRFSVEWYMFTTGQHSQPEIWM